MYLVILSLSVCGLGLITLFLLSRYHALDGLCGHLEAQQKTMQKQAINDGKSIEALEDELDEYRKRTNTHLAEIDRKLRKPYDRITHTEEEVEGRRGLQPQPK